LKGLLLPLWVSVAAVGSATEVRFPEAATVFHCAFDGPWDKNFDAWPDGWTRRRGRDYPHYVDIQLTGDHDSRHRHLRIDLDGGAAAVYSPPAPVDTLFGYVLEGRLQTQGLRHDRAYLSLTLLDEERRPLGTYRSEKIRETNGWRTLGIGPIAPDDERVRFALVGLHVEPTDREDITGSVLLDDVWLGRLPRMTLRLVAANHLFTDPEDVVVRCAISGELEEEPRVALRLEDALGEALALETLRMKTRSARARDAAAIESGSRATETRIATAEWKPPLALPGFYRVTAEMEDSKAGRRESTTLAVLKPRRPPVGGRFGWSIPGGDRHLPLGDLAHLIAQAGVSQVKYPMWHREDHGEQRLDRLIDFEKQLDHHGIELVGLLGEPPETLRNQYNHGGGSNAAVVLTAAPDVWYPALEPVMTRLATRVRWWQLGADADTSFVGYPGLAGRIGAVKETLDRLGQDVRVGLGWTWSDPLPDPETEPAPWSFVALSSEPGSTADDLAGQLESSPSTRAQRWVSIVPLGRKEHSPEQRTADLIRRMIAAKIHGADAIFCPDPFDPKHGLIHTDGTPGELFLPWRTTALLLGGTEYLGNIVLPEGSTNHLFARGDEVVMVVWNDEPREEVIFLGDDVRQVDPWGREATPEPHHHRQVIRVERLPSFVTGITGAIARWRMNCRFERDRIPTVFGREHDNAVTLTNSFVGGIRGEVKVVAPSIWTVEPGQAALDLAGAEAFRHPLRIFLPPNATSGEHAVRIDFEIDSPKPCRFSVYRRLKVGLGDVRLEFATRLDDEGNLEVRQVLINDSDTPVGFQCELFAPGRRRMTSVVAHLPRSRHTHVYRLENGKELLGRILWLRARELDGPRTLSHRFVAEGGGEREVGSSK